MVKPDPTPPLDRVPEEARAHALQRASMERHAIRQARKDEKLDAILRRHLYQFKQEQQSQRPPMHRLHH